MHKVNNLNVLDFQPLISPKELREHLPLTEAADQTVWQSREAIHNILQGKDNRLLIISGPCSIHDEAQALEYARRLVGLRQKYKNELEIVMRVYMDKPRTTVGWRGYLNDPDMNFSNDVNLGLHKTRSLMLKINEMGMPIATELLDPFIPQYIPDVLAWGAIGARTTESQTHRAMVSGISAPVGFKNATSGDIKVAVDAIVSAQKPHTFLGITDTGQAAVVSTKGNPYGHVILRGGKQGKNFAEPFVQEAIALMQNAHVQPAVIVDCSHQNCASNHELQQVAWRDVLEQRKQGERRLVGMMIESHIHAGKQSIPSDLSQLKYGVSITDACIGWEETEVLMEQAAAAMKQEVVS